MGLDLKNCSALVRTLAAVSSGMVVAACGGGGGSGNTSTTLSPDADPPAVLGTEELPVAQADGVSTDSPGEHSEVAENNSPEAKAGPDQVVNEGSVVTLDGRASADADNDELTYWWTLSAPLDSQAMLSDPTSSMTTFQADVPGSYRASLTVYDGHVESDVDVTLVTANALVVNSPPEANAGSDGQAAVEETVTLDGSGSSDPDGDGIGYAWTLTIPLGSTATLFDAASPRPYFSTDTPGIYTATLIVNDGRKNSAPDSVSIEVSLSDSASITATSSSVAVDSSGAEEESPATGLDAAVPTTTPPAADNDPASGGSDSPRGPPLDLIHSGAALLSWTPPTEREDGSLLDDLAGYRIYYGRGRAGVEKMIDVENPGLASFMVEDLKPGAWHFAVTAVDADGRESRRSNIASKEIPQ
jgi:hypothetical protein